MQALPTNSKEEVKEVYKEIKLNTIIQGGVMNSQYSYYKFNMNGQKKLITIK